MSFTSKDKFEKFEDKNFWWLYNRDNFSEPLYLQDFGGSDLIIF